MEFKNLSIKKAIDNIPKNLFLDIKARKQLKEFHKELISLLAKKRINQKNGLNKGEKLNIKESIISLIEIKFKDKDEFLCGKFEEYRLEIFIFCLCECLESQLTKTVEGYKLFEISSNSNALFQSSKSKDNIVSFLISFYDFFEEELVVNYNEIISEVISKNKAINDSFLLSLIKILNLLSISIATDEFNNIFKGAIINDNRYNNLYDLGFLIIKIIESLNCIMRESNKNNNLENHIKVFIKISFNNIIPCFIDFFCGIILEYALKSTMNSIFKKNEFILLFNELSKEKKIRIKLIKFLNISNQLFNQEQNNYISKTIQKNKVLENILNHIYNDINNYKNFSYEFIAVIKYFIFYEPAQTSIDKKILMIFNYIKVSMNKKEAKTENLTEKDLHNLIKEINMLSTEEPNRKYKVYNLLFFLFQFGPYLRKSICKVFLDNFENDLEEYKDMIGNSKFLAMFVGSICKCDAEVINYFFKILFSFEENGYIPFVEITNLISSLSLFTNALSIKSLIQNLKILNVRINYKEECKINTKNNMKLDSNKENNKNIKASNSENSKKEKEALDYINQNFIDTFLNIIKDINNSQDLGNNKRNSNNERNLFSVQMLLPLLEYLDLINKDKKICEFFNQKNFLQYFDSIVNKSGYKVLAYKLMELSLKYSDEKEKNEEKVNIILKRFETILILNSMKSTEVNINESINKLKELILLLNILKISFSEEIYPSHYDKNKKITLGIGTKINRRIIICFFKYFDFINDNKNNIMKVYNLEYYELHKRFINILFEIIKISNENVLLKKNNFSPVLSLGDFKNLFIKIILIYRTINNGNNKFFLGIIIYFIDKALGLDEINKKNNNNIDIQTKDIFVTFYMNKFSMETKTLSLLSNTKPNFSNICVRFPIMIISILDCLYKLNLNTESFLNFIYFLFLVNEANISILLRENLLQYLLKIASDSSKFKNILIKIFTCCFKFLNKENLRLIFEYLIKWQNNNNNNFIKDLLKCLIFSLNKFLIPEFDNSKGIFLSHYIINQPNIYNIIKIHNVNFQCDSESIITIKQKLFFSNSITQNKLILLKLQLDETSTRQMLEISLNNFKLTVSENENILQENSKLEDEIEISTREFLKVNNVNILIYTFDKCENKLSININGKNILSCEFKLIFPNQKPIKLHPKKSSSITQNELKNRNEGGVIMFTGYPKSSLENISDEKFHLFSYLKILSFNVKIDSGNKKGKKSNIIYELNIDKVFLLNKIQTNLTEFKLDDNTLLNCENNLFNYASINYIYPKSGIKSRIYNNLLYIDNYLNNSLDYYFRIEKYLFILLHSNSLNEEIFRLIIDLFSKYLMVNSKYLSKYLSKIEISSSLYFVFYKNSLFIDKEIIQLLFTSFLGFNNLDFTIVSDILLDTKIFSILKKPAKIEVLNLTVKKLLVEKNEINVLIVDKLSKILLLNIEKDINDNDNEKDLDELIIDIIFKFLSKDSKNEKLNKIIKNLFYVLFKFSQFTDEHLIKFNKKRKEETFDILNTFFEKIYEKKIVGKLCDILLKKLNSNNILSPNYKEKLIEICKSYQNPLAKRKNSSRKNSSDIKAKLFAEFNCINDKNDKENKDYQGNNDYCLEDDSISSDEEETKDNLENYKSNDVELQNNNKTKKMTKIVTDVLGSVGITKKIISPLYSSDFFIDTKRLNNFQNRDSWMNAEHKNLKIKFRLNDNEKILCIGNCYLCNFIKEILSDLFKRENKFNFYKNYILHIYTETFIFNKNLDYKLNFSYYLMKEEGFNRIRKKFEPKVDNLLNHEIDYRSKLNKGQIEKYVESEVDKMFMFYKDGIMSDNLRNFFNLGQIFNIDFAYDCVDPDDSYQSCCNCLFLRGFNQINSVLILGKKKIYMLLNVNVSTDLILYYAKTPIKKSFWVLDNYLNILENQCQYLQAYDKIDNKINKFQKEDKGFRFFSFSYLKINELHKRRFVHQNNALEIFLKNGKNFYLVFNTDLRDTIIAQILQNISFSLYNRYNNLENDKFTFTDNDENINVNTSNLINNFTLNSLRNENMIFLRDNNLFIEKTNKIRQSNLKYKDNNKLKNKKKSCTILDVKEILGEATEKWSLGLITTYSYIMILNTLSGRTYNDLSQYPIYPWILNNYNSKILDLNDSQKYRDFSFPIYAQNEDYRQKIKEKYESFEDKNLKYHCGSHYSNALFVCYFLVRVKPFSNIAAEIQGKRIDEADRLFFNIFSLYKINDKFQELIPEFFNLPEIYININNFDYGKTLENIKVSDVVLPPWASFSPRIFCKINKKALESQYVSQNINNWIDLIFGNKREEPEAEKYYNVLRKECLNFNPKDCIDDSEVESKINVLNEFGYDPLQLFTKTHPKRDKHQITKAFFGRSIFLTHFKPKENKFSINNFDVNTKIKEIRKFNENSSGILSHGEGGLTSFKKFYENININKDKNMEKNNDLYFIVGEKKVLLPPSYKNFIEYGNRNTFSIIKPFKKVKYTFKINHMKKHSIQCMKASNNGKFIIIGYSNGVIEKYKIKNFIKPKESNNLYKNIITEPESTKHSANQSLIHKMRSDDIKKNNNNEIGGKIYNFFSEITKIKFNESSRESINNKKSDLKESNCHTENNINLYQSLKPHYSNNFSNNIDNKNIDTFNAKISVSCSNIKNSDCILLNEKDIFLQYSGIISSYDSFNEFKINFDIEGYYVHSINQSEIKSMISKSAVNKNSNSLKTIHIYLVNSSSRILNEISLIDLCEPYSFMIVVDKTKKIYLYDFNTFNLLKCIDFSSMFIHKIKFTSICKNTGDFFLASKNQVALMNINGVFLTLMSNVQSKINSCYITVIPTTQSDIFLFTGHEDGNLIVSKLINNIYEEIHEESSSSSITRKDVTSLNKINDLEDYRDAYSSKEQNYRKYLNKSNLSLIFETIIQIKCSSFPIKFIKLTEDLAEVICIDGKNKLIYLSYEEFIDIKNKNKGKKNIKLCPTCHSTISSSKILCYICGRKLCAQCKIEKIIAEYSLKTPKPICEECQQFTSTTNRMLYDF